MLPNTDRERYLKHFKELDAQIAATEWQIDLRSKESAMLWREYRAIKFACLWYTDTPDSPLEYPELIYPHAFVSGVHHVFN